MITENENLEIQSNKSTVKTENIINISYSSDKNYAKYLALSMATVLTSKAPDEKIKFFILDGGLTTKDRENIFKLKNISDCEINFINVSKDVFADCPLGESKYLSIAMYYRLLLPDFLPDIDKIIYLDCDVQVKGSLKELFNTNLEENILGAVHDINNEMMSKIWHLNEYYNSGVLLLNLDKLRKIEFTRNLYNYINEYQSKLLYPDQDLINICFKNQIKTLDPKWNFQSLHINRNNANTNSIINHYIAAKKGFYIHRAFPLIRKTNYIIPLLLIWSKYIAKIASQWIFMLRRKDSTTKVLTILGFKFYIKCKP